jgi:hypothetical protein
MDAGPIGSLTSNKNKGNADQQQSNTKHEHDVFGLQRYNLITTLKGTIGCADTFDENTRAWLGI